MDSIIKINDYEEAKPNEKVIIILILNKNKN